MTFIVAIQLNDSVIVAADHKHIIFSNDGTNQVKEKLTSKLDVWNKGLITGTGERNVVDNTITLFKKIADSDLQKLPQCLNISRQMRELTLGQDYFHVTTTKLLCTNYDENTTQIYTVERMSDSEPYELNAVTPMTILIWMFEPDVSAVMQYIKTLYAELRNMSEFEQKSDWIDYYLKRISPIYKIQSQFDAAMSQSFDVIFQMKDDYIALEILNTHHNTIKFT